jgi:hypothetical protein
MLPVAGAFASINPRSVVLAGGGFFVAGDDGVTVARFAWADPSTGRASNMYAAESLLGFVQPVAGAYRRLSVEHGITLRPGYPATLFAAGDFYARFAAGAQAGQPVYASVLDGEAVSGEADDAIQTPWYVVTNCGPGELAIISTWSTPI